MCRLESERGIEGKEGGEKKLGVPARGRERERDRERIVGFSFHLHNGRTTMHFVLS